MKRVFNLLWSHTRNMDMLVSPKVIEYRIPLYSELPILGRFKSIRVENSSIVIEFHKKELPTDKNIPLQ